MSCEPEPEPELACGGTTANTVLLVSSLASWTVDFAGVMLVVCLVWPGLCTCCALWLALWPVLPPLNIVLLILTSKNKSKIKNMCTTNRYMLSTNGNISISGTNMSIVKSVVSWFNKSSIQVDILLFLNFSVKVANTILIEKSSRPISIDSEVDDTGNEFVDNALDGVSGVNGE